MAYAGLDFETYCDLSLPEVGLDRYVNHPSFRPLLASVARRGSKQDFDLLDPEGYRAFHAYLALRQTSLVFAAHNADFERAVLKRIGSPLIRVVCTAAMAREMGSSSSLWHASRQLLNIEKLEEGADLIKKFCMPPCNPDDIDLDSADWKLFREYCGVDANCSLEIAILYETFRQSTVGSAPVVPYESLTSSINFQGWPVDVDLVKKMHELAETNIETHLTWFKECILDKDEKLNFNSTPQLRKWVKKRGLNIQSFNELSVHKWVNKIQAQLNKKQNGLTPDQISSLVQVANMLNLKKELGGASIKKLPAILKTTGDDARLRFQYLHYGAAQSARTSARGVQLQNLKRLTEFPLDVDDDQVLALASNEELGAAIRQVFKASHPEGCLIVGDLSSIESRGLAHIAGEEWKMDAFKAGKDLYKVQAASMYKTRYEDVTKMQRTSGKVGELSCGYGAGGGAVRSFAEKMGIDMTLLEANKLVVDFRAANQGVVKLWKSLEDALRKLLLEFSFGRGYQAAVRVPLGGGLMAKFESTHTPSSLIKQEPDKNLVSVKMSLAMFDGYTILSRIFHGCYLQGRNILFFKPSTIKSGPLWKDRYRDQKSGQTKLYSLYGGKLTGILTQSMCREIFFYGMRAVHDWLYNKPSSIVGQFHDEIVVEFVPESHSRLNYNSQRIAVENKMHGLMTQGPAWLSDFPLEANVESAVRYLK